jgi:hypothetical protein
MDLRVNNIYGIGQSTDFEFSDTFFEIYGIGESEVQSRYYYLDTLQFNWINIEALNPNPNQPLISGTFELHFKDTINNLVMNVTDGRFDFGGQLTVK